jgi:hypothetical protein
MTEQQPRPKMSVTTGSHIEMQGEPGVHPGGITYRQSVNDIAKAESVDTAHTSLMTYNAMNNTQRYAAPKRVEVPIIPSQSGALNSGIASDDTASQGIFSAGGYALINKSRTVAIQPYPVMTESTCDGVPDSRSLTLDVTRRTRDAVDLAILKRQRNRSSCMKFRHKRSMEMKRLRSTAKELQELVEQLQADKSKRDQEMLEWEKKEEEYKMR